MNNASMEIPENKITFIAGANGSGKTTFIKCLLNIEKYQGNITYNGMGFEEVRQLVSVVYDKSLLFPTLTGYQNIELLTNISIKNKAVFQMNEALSDLLTKDKLKEKVKHYSLGEKKKLSLLIGLLNKPKFLFMDEISNGLDYQSLEKLKIMLKNLSLTTTILVCGHHLEFYSSFVDNVFILKNNSIVKFENFKKNEEDGDDISEIYKQFSL